MTKGWKMFWAAKTLVEVYAAIRRIEEEEARAREIKRREHPYYRVNS